MFALDEERDTVLNPLATIKVLGIGGAGSNTVNSIIDLGFEDIDCIVANTDLQALNFSKAKFKVQLGIKSTKGLGAGADPNLGKRAAEEDLDKIMDLLANADIVFLTAGMGGGTGSGAAPVIARALKERNILSIAVITKPFTFEGKKRERVACEAIEQLKKVVDTLILIPNQKLLEVAAKNITMIEAFAMVNDVLGQSVKGISDIIAKPGHINVDFADLRTIMKGMGLAVMGTGKSRGEQRVKEATLQAIASPLLENMNIKGARGVLLNITANKSLSLHEISEAASVIYEQADEDANIILGSVIDETMQEDALVTVVATGFGTPEAITSIPQKQPVYEKKAMQTPQEVIQQSSTELSQTAKKSPEPEESSYSSELTADDPLDVPTYLRKKEHQDHKSV